MHSVEMGQGASPVFILVHGLGMSGRYMMPTAELLVPHGKVHIPDLPGFGLSDDPTRVLTVPELADALLRWVDARQIPAGILVGNSLGGQVIIDFAARYPDRLTGAVLVGPTIDPDARRSLVQIWRLLVDIFREPGRLIAIGVADYLRAGFHWCLRTLHHALAHPVLEMLPRIRVPVLLVRGGRDPITSEAWADRATALIPRAWHVTIPHAAHAVNFNAPEDLVREILDFAREQSLLD